MGPRVFFSAPADWWPLYEPHLRRACAAEGVSPEFLTEADGGRIDYIVHRPGGPVAEFSGYPGLKAVLSLWAGVEGLVGDPTLDVPLVRMIDESLTAGMAEWVAGHVLRHHLGMDAHVLGQDGVWRNGIIPPLARERSVGVLGMGALGTASARMLAGIGFRVHGWSRRLRQVDGAVTRSGPDGLREVLAASEILVLLLPATPGTASVMDAAAFAALPRGAVVINPGRGALIDDGALLAALDSGHLAHATLDVFREEPLPPAHPFWAHPRVTVTPHIASETRPETASEAIARNIRRGEDGEAFVGLVDRAAGY